MLYFADCHDNFTLVVSVNGAADKSVYKLYKPVLMHGRL